MIIKTVKINIIIFVNCGTGGGLLVDLYNSWMRRINKILLRKKLKKTREHYK
jgi:hypothetical protein